MVGKLATEGNAFLEELFIFPKDIKNVDNWIPSDEEKQALILYDTEFDLLSGALASHIETVLKKLEEQEESLVNANLEAEEQSKIFAKIEEHQKDLKASLIHYSMVLKKHAFMHQNLLVTNGKAHEMEEKFQKIKKVLSNEEMCEIPSKNESYEAFDETNNKRMLILGWTKWLRAAFVDVNWWRLFLIRIRRVGDAFALIANTPMGNPEINKALGYLGWIFYVPRVSVNLFWLTQHWLFPSNEHEQGVSMSQRFLVQSKRRWAELSNDIVWMVVGLINCFVLTGLSAMGLTTALYFFDVLVAGIRYYEELTRNQRMKDAISRTKATYGSNDPDLDRYLQSVLNALEDKIIARRRMLIMSLVTATILAVCTSLFFFSMLGTPWLAPVAASLILLTCIGTKLVLEPYFKKERALKDIIIGASLTTAGASLIATGVFMITGLLAASALAGPLVIAAGVFIVIGASILSYYLSSPGVLKDKKEPPKKTRSFEEILDGCERTMSPCTSGESLSKFGVFSRGTSPAMSPTLSEKDLSLYQPDLFEGNVYP